MLGLLLLSSAEISPVLNFDEKLFYTMIILTSIKLIQQSFVIKVLIAKKLFKKYSCLSVLLSVLMFVMLLSFRFPKVLIASSKYAVCV